MERRYSSPLREQQQEMTRTRIVEALAALISEGKIYDFTVRDVAERAGVSYGSVYRHYPTREALLEALHTMNERMPHTPTMPGNLAELPAFIRHAVSVFEGQGETMMAVSRAMTALNVRPEGTRRRDAQVQALIEAAVPGIGQSELRQAAAILRHLTNAAAWTFLRQSLGLSAEETAAALSWATETLIRDLTQRATKGETE